MRHKVKGGEGGGVVDECICILCVTCTNIGAIRMWKPWVFHERLEPDTRRDSQTEKGVGVP